MLKMSGFLHKNHWDSPTLTLVNVFGVLGYLNVLNSGWHVNSVKDSYIKIFYTINIAPTVNVLNVLYVLHTCASYMRFIHVLHVLHGCIVGMLGLVF